MSEKFYEVCPTCEGVGWCVCDSNHCVACDGDGVVNSSSTLAELSRLRELEAKYDVAIALLREVEWSGWGVDPCCPSCMADPPGGHEPDCELAKILGSPTKEEA